MGPNSSNIIPTVNQGGGGGVMAWGRCAATGHEPPSITDGAMNSALIQKIVYVRLFSEAQANFAAKPRP